MTVFKGAYPSIHGRKVGLTQDDALVSKGGFVSGGIQTLDKTIAGTVVLPSPTYWTLFDDFISGGTGVAKSALDTGVGGGPWIPNVGTDTGTTADGNGLVANAKVGIRSGAQGGMAALQIHTNDSYAGAGDGATSCHSILGPRCCSVDTGTAKGRFHMAARVRMEDTGDVGKHTVFIGFTDDTGTAGQMAIYIDTGVEKSAASNGGDFTAKATNAVGLLMGARNGDTGLGQAANKWAGVAVNGGTVTTAPTVSDTGLHPREWKTLEVLFDKDETDSGGTAYFAVDGNWFGSVDAPIATEASILAPVITLGVNAGEALADSDDTGSIRLDIDWISVSGLRAQKDTGS